MRRVEPGGSAADAVPREAAIVVVGGGAVGCAAAHALAEAGFGDILVLERREGVGLETTSQGAGLCGQVRDTVERTRLAMHSVAVFRRLQQGAVKPDWSEVGSLRIALSDARAAEFARLHRVAGEAGLETHLLTPAEASRHWPLLDWSRVRSVLWCPSDGHMMPASVTASYRHHAEQLGVRFATGIELTGVQLDGGRVVGIETSAGRIRCGRLVNSAGAHAYHVARMAGLELPVFPVRHEYFVTVAMDGLEPGLPCFRIPEWTLYGRVREGGLLLGGWEPRALGLDPRSYPASGAPPPVTVDWPVLEGFSASFAALFPGVRDVKRSWVGRGWPTFTPDGRFLVGESRRVPGLVFATGCNAHGISGSGGLGRMLVESLTAPEPGGYVRSLAPDRFLEREGATGWAEDQEASRRVYETYYGV